MTHHHHDEEDVEGAAQTAGMVPSQWFVRMLLVALVALGTAALVVSRNDIRRYAKIKQM